MNDPCPPSDLLAPIPWETRNLGRASFALRQTWAQGLALDRLREAVAEQTARGPCFIQAKSEAHAVADGALLAGAGFSFIETVLHPHAHLQRNGMLEAFERDPAGALRGRLTLSQVSFQPVDAADAAARGAIGRIAGSAFSLDRFHLDPRCGKAVADRRMVLWVEEMFEQGTCFYLLRVEGAAAGFMARHDDHLPLAGIAPAFERGGLGDFLWLATMADMKRRGIGRVHTAISAHNVGVLNLYARLGYRFRNPLHVYHFWSDGPTP